MIKARAWPAKAMYMLIAAALAISLLIMVAPTQKVSASPGLSEWTRVNSPTTDGWVLAPCSVIIDYALAEGGEVAYAIVESAFNTTDCDTMGRGEYYLLKSDDYGATWDDITGSLEDELEDEYWEGVGFELLSVATDWVDPDFVAVAVDAHDISTVHVYFSTDGGETFEDIGDIPEFTDPDLVADLAVSYEADDEREVVIGGGDGTAALLFRSTVTEDNAGNWEDATRYDGWDDDEDPTGGDPAPFDSELVTDIIFSPSWATDKTILVTTITDVSASYDVHLQCGSFGTTEGWNEWSTLGIEAVEIMDNVDLPDWLAYWDARAIAGITLPEDYNSKDTDARVLWVWVNYYDDDEGYPACTIVRVDDDSAGPLIGGKNSLVEEGEVWLTNISYKGTIATGEAIAGVLGNGMGDYEECCEGVQVYRNDGIHEMDICCERWHDACKPPTGVAGMAVSYVGDDKAYAVSLLGEPCNDEGAWSVTFDDGDTWNQLSLIDTHIDYFSDVAVSPDCNKTMLVSVQKVPIENGSDECFCDSVWLYADDNLPEAPEYTDQWLRTWCGELEGDEWKTELPLQLPEAGFLRLAPEETTGDTVVLFDYRTSNVYWNGLETLACWDSISSPVLDEIVDLALQDADTIFALDAEGDVAMLDDDEWHKAVESKVDEGNTIAVWGDWILVGGNDGEVSLSDDGGETFDLVEDIPTIDGWVTVAFDTYFDTNMRVYAATFEDDFTGGIYSWEIGEDEKWQDLKAEPYEWQVLPSSMWTSPDGDKATVDVAYNGLVVDRPGNPYTDADNGGVIYASYMGVYNSTWFTGAARSLERMIDVCSTCLDWDFLHVGLTFGDEGFNEYPDALKICGCLTPDSNSHLFAIDSWFYDMCENEDGSVWTYEDCYAKKAPEIDYPADGQVIAADPCSCYSVPFTVLWDSICDACSYDIAFALDEEFEMPVKVNGEKGEVYHIVSDTPSFSVMGGEAGGLSCETTYYVRIRAADAATDEIIHSWWSDPIEITIAPSLESGEITLVSPEPGATGVAIKKVGFSWDLLAKTSSFDWWIDDNSDFSSPVESKTGLTSKAYECTVDLEYDTSYYWQVIAYDEGVPISTSAVGTFRTMAEPDEPPPVEEPTTPTWVWVVIAIGAVLVIVVIVLIFRTRRV